MQLCLRRGVWTFGLDGVSLRRVGLRWAPVTNSITRFHKAALFVGGVYGGTIRAPVYELYQLMDLVVN